MAVGSKFWMARVREMDDKFQRLTGREAWGHLSIPSKGDERWTFADGTVCKSGPEARDYMATLMWLAADSPEKLPYPFDQPLEPSQDLRILNGWLTEEQVALWADGEPTIQQRAEGAMNVIREWRKNPPEDG